jgi:hypothetical protein
VAIPAAKYGDADDRVDYHEKSAELLTAPHVIDIFKDGRNAGM